MRLYPNGYSPSRQVRHVRDGTYFPVVTFVSKDLVVLARKRDFALEICEIRGDDSSAFGLHTVCILKLPSLHPSTRVRFYMRNRTPFATDSSPLAVRSNRLPFRSSPADALLGFEISVRRSGRPGSEVRRLAFWVHHSAFRKYAAQAARPSRTSPELRNPRSVRGLASRLVYRIGHTFATTPVLHWLEWGPKSTRWRECSDDLRDRQTLAGMRCAVVHQGSLTLMDFSPGRIAMLLAQDSPENSGMKIVRDPTRITAGRCFLRDFMSKLPYCESTREEIKNRVLMDDEWILQFEVRISLMCLVVLWLKLPATRRRRVYLVGRVIFISTAFYRQITLARLHNQKHSFIRCSSYFNTTPYVCMYLISDDRLIRLYFFMT